MTKSPLESGRITSPNALIVAPGDRPLPRTVTAPPCTGMRRLTVLSKPSSSVATMLRFTAIGAVSSNLPVASNTRCTTTKFSPLGRLIVTVPFGSIG